MKQGKILLTFHEVFCQKTGYKRIEACIISHKTLSSTKSIRIKTIYIPDPDSVHACNVEAEKIYVCTKLKVIHAQNNNLFRLISVLVLKECPQKLALDSEPSPLLLCFQTGNDKRNRDWGLGKTQMDSFWKNDGMTTRYFVDQRESLQPHEGEVWYCKPVELVYLDEKRHFRMVRVQLLYLESIILESIATL